MTRQRASRSGFLRPALAAILLAILAAVIVPGCTPAPQFGNSENCVQATDALWTAVSSRDAKLLDDCERHLTELKSGGDVTLEACEYLQEVIRNARQGDWDRARTALKRLIDDQRGK